MIKIGTIKGNSYHITCTWAVYEPRTLKVVSSECYDNGRSSSSLIFHTFLIFIFMDINANCKLEGKKKKNKIKNQRTNGPVNAHLRSASYTNKHI